MSAVAVARKDLLDVRRARLVWFVCLLYALLVTALFAAGQRRPTPDALFELWNVAGVGSLLVPLLALVTAYLAIAGERESGSLQYLLATPIVRRDVVLGKYLSRGTTVSGSLLLAFLLGFGLTVGWYPSVDPAPFVAVAVLTCLYALTYVAVAIAISSSVAARSRAMGWVIACYVGTTLAVIFGRLSLVGVLGYLLNDLLDLGVSQNLLELVRVLVSPTAAYLRLLPLAFPADFPLAPADPTVWYLRPPVVLAVLLAWLVLPLAIAVWRFDRTDL